VATKHEVTAPRSKHTASHRESDGSRFGRPGRFRTCQHRSQSAGASTSRRVVPNSRVSDIRRDRSRSDGTRIVTAMPALPRKPAPGVRLMDGLYRTTVKTTSRPAPTPFSTPTRRPRADTEG